jgi:hypothetical protein
LNESFGSESLIHGIWHQKKMAWPTKKNEKKL